MLWQGIRLFTRKQYEALGPSCRFILTDEVHKVLHPEMDPSYIGKSLIIINTGKKQEIEVEGVNFLAVDDDVPDFTVISMKEAERRYPDDIRDVRQTGSSLISKLFQDDQDRLVAKKTRKKKPASKPVEKKEGFLSKLFKK